jgi:hypothetical protein
MKRSDRKRVGAQKAYLVDPSQKTLEVFLISRHFLRSRAVEEHESRGEHLTVSQECENLPGIEQRGCQFHLGALRRKGCDRGVRRRGI